MVYKQNGIDIYYYNYKEPFIKFKGGFGFEGALGYSLDKKKVQCHFCGEFYKSIRSSHIQTCEGVKRYEKKNNVLIEDTNDYKDIVGLNRTSALIGEETRLKLIQNAIDCNKKLQVSKWNDKEQKKERGKKLSERNRRRTGEKISMEKRNKSGTCPVQLLERIKEVHQALGHTPTKKEFYNFFKGKYLGAIYQVHGSWVEAVKKAGFIPVSLSDEHREYEYTNEQLLQALREFYERFGRLSTSSDHTRGLLPSYWTYTNRFGSINNARRQAELPVKYKVGTFKYIYDYSSCNSRYLVKK